MATIHLTRADMRRLAQRIQKPRPMARRVPRRPRPDDPCARTVSATVPYTAQAWSKNRAWCHRRDGRVYLATPARQARAALAQALSLDCAQRGCLPPWPARKTWLGLVVALPTQRGDAINVLDGVADAVQRAIRVNDAHFAVRCLDWTIDPADPRIEITVSQEAL